ncbi:MAG: trigger factor [Pseudomonadota bacterium]
MQVTVESTGTLERKLRVVVPAERIEKEVNTRLRSVGKSAKIHGFRPGKVPPKVVKQRYGKQIRQEVLSELMQKSYTDAIVQENLNPAGQPSIEPENEGETGAFAYVATLEVMPEVELKDLDKLSVDQPEVTIGDADMDDMIEKLRHQKATWTPVERESKDGDRVTCDFNGTLKGEPIDGGQGSNVPVVLGQGQMLPDFEKGLTKVKAGDETSFKVKFPKDYQAEDLQGESVDFAVVVHNVEEMTLPEVDDEFAKMFNVEEGGIEQFRADVRDNMEREAADKVRNDVRDQLMRALVEANPIEIPNTLKHQEMHAMQHDAMRRLGIEDAEQAPALENFAEQAEHRVKLGLLIRQVIADNEITLDQDSLRSHIQSMVAGYENPDEMVEMYMSNPQILQQIEPMALEQKAIDWLLDNGTVKSKQVAFTDYMNS